MSGRLLSMGEQAAPLSPVNDPIRAMLMQHIVGFIDPVFTEELPNGRHMHALADRDDFKRIMEGYACGECLAKFDCYMEICPACGLSRADAAKVDKTPGEWDAFHQEHLHGGVTGAPNTFEQMMDAQRADVDVETVALSRLRPGSAKRRRG